MVVCTGRNAHGGHCCWIDGVQCPLLFIDRGGMPRCSVWGEWEKEPYLSSAAAKSLNQFWSGKTCADWPQNIPEAMADLSGKCCWQVD